jgi:hypothetical protein
MKMPKGRASYWEAKRKFKHGGHDVEVFVDAPAPELPPVELQQRFFSAVEERFEELLVAAESVLRPQFERWTRQPLLKPFGEEFTLSSLSVPCKPLDQAEWEMSFESATDPNHLFSVAFHGAVAKGVLIDG